jgi:hypothetical protein
MKNGFVTQATCRMGGPERVTDKLGAHMVGVTVVVNELEAAHSSLSPAKYLVA